MMIGLDFDNTIVSYDALFHRAASEELPVPPTLVPTKTAVRDWLRLTGRETAWTALQGKVYGARMAEAAPYPGIVEFIQACRAAGQDLCIISHKTRHPFLGPPYDLHAAALGWLETHGFFAAAGCGLSRDEIFFELTKPAKLARIAACRCDVYIDDLPEILTDAAFPSGVRKILFDPTQAHAATAGITRLQDWPAIQNHLLRPKNGGEIAGLARLAAQLPAAVVSEPEALPGGANNRVRLLHGANGERWLLKEYYAHADDPRDRFGTERNFYRYAWEVAGARCIPQPLAWDPEAKLGAFEYIPGEKSAAPDLSWDDVNAALNFVAVLNRSRDRAEARALAPAAEACFRVTAHAATVQKRMSRLEHLPGRTRADAAARDFVNEELIPAWAFVRTDLARLAENEIAAGELDPSQRCLSPSDFGFHNARRRANGTWVFFDFEYAGWDDPAKLVCDFFSQPAIPVPSAYFDAAAQHLATLLELDSQEEFVARCHVLLPVYRVKWCGIMLNEFLAQNQTRRQFAFGAAEAESRKHAQLGKARTALDSLRLTPVR